MNGYICMKAISLSGTQYVPGDAIPAEAVLPGRVLALTRSKYIAEVGDEDLAARTPVSPQNRNSEPTPINIPISTAEGLLEAPVSSQTVITAFTILQLSEKDAKAAIADVEDDDALMLMNAVERRKNVLTALKERHETLTEGAGGDNGQNV